MLPEEIIYLAHSLREIDRRLLATTGVQATKRVWYQGGEPYFDLFLELEEQNIKWFQFTLRGNSLSWQRYPNVWQTGKTQELQPRLNPRLQPASKVVEQDQQFDREFGELVRSIILVRAKEPIFARLELLLQEMPGQHSPNS